MSHSPSRLLLFFRHLLFPAIFWNLSLFLGCALDKGTFPVQILNFTSPDIDPKSWNNVANLYFLSENRYLWVGESRAAVIDGITRQVIREFSFLPEDPKPSRLLGVYLSKDEKTLITNFKVFFNCGKDVPESCNYYQSVAGFDIESGQRIFTKKPPFPAYISIDGSMMAVPDFSVTPFNTVIVDINTNQEIFRIPNSTPLRFLNNRAYFDASRNLPSNNRYIAVTRNHGYPDEVWDIQTRSKIGTIPTYQENSVYSISPNGRMALVQPATLAGSGVRWIWDIKNSRLAHTLAIDGETGDLDIIEVESFSPDSSKVLTFGGHWDSELEQFTSAYIHVWNTFSGDLFRTIEPLWDPNRPSTFPNLAGFRPNSNEQIWIGRLNESIQFWNIDSGDLSARILAIDAVDYGQGALAISALHNPRFSPDGTKLMTMTQHANQLVFWDLTGI